MKELSPALWALYFGLCTLSFGTWTLDVFILTVASARCLGLRPKDENRFNGFRALEIQGRNQPLKWLKALREPAITGLKTR
jgi:hypothetical protein